MYYEVNVAQPANVNGQTRYVHWFATAPRSISTTEKAFEVAQSFRSAWPDCQVTVTRYETIGEQVTF